MLAITDCVEDLQCKLHLLYVNPSLLLVMCNPACLARTGTIGDFLKESLLQKNLSVWEKGRIVVTLFLSH